METGRIERRHNGVGQDVVFHGVAGTDAFARRGLRAGGFLRVGAVGGQAFVGRWL
jgi:hypothetical protein